MVNEMIAAWRPSCRGAEKTRPSSTDFLFFGSFSATALVPLCGRRSCRGAEKRRPSSTDFYFVYGFASVGTSLWPQKLSWCRKTKALFNRFFYSFSTTALVPLRGRTSCRRAEKQRPSSTVLFFYGFPTTALVPLRWSRCCRGADKRSLPGHRDSGMIFVQ